MHESFINWVLATQAAGWGRQGPNILWRRGRRGGEEARHCTVVPLSTQPWRWRAIFTADMLGDFYHKMVNNYNQEGQVRMPTCEMIQERWQTTDSADSGLRYSGIIALISSHYLSSNSRTSSSTPRTLPFLFPVVVSPPPAWSVFQICCCCLSWSSSFRHC